MYSKKSILTLLLTFITIYSTPKTLYKYTYPKQFTSKHQTISKADTSSNNESIKKELTEKIDKYIEKIAPKSKLSGEIIVDGCLEYNIEPAFVLAQGQIESHFGTTGSAKQTNSAWNVGAHDGKNVSWMSNKGFTYTHPNKSLQPYLELLKTKYLVRGKTIHHLMQNYISSNGHRYASSKTYEQSLKQTYNNIISSTDINKLYIQLKHNV